MKHDDALADHGAEEHPGNAFSSLEPKLKQATAKCFGVGVLEIIEASKGIVGGTKGCSINNVGAPGVFIQELAQGSLVVERGKSGCGIADSF